MGFHGNLCMGFPRNVNGSSRFMNALQHPKSDSSGVPQGPASMGGPWIVLGSSRALPGRYQGATREPVNLCRNCRNRRLTRVFTFRTSPKIYMDFSEIFSGFSWTFPGFFLGLKNGFFTIFMVKKSIFYKKKTEILESRVRRLGNQE